MVIWRKGTYRFKNGFFICITCSYLFFNMSVFRGESLSGNQGNCGLGIFDCGKCSPAAIENPQSAIRNPKFGC